MDDRSLRRSPRTPLLDTSSDLPQRAALDSDVLHGDRPGRGPGRAAGAAPTALVRSAAVEPVPSGVRVNAVAAGVVRTPRSPPRRAPGAAAQRGERPAGPGRRDRGQRGRPVRPGPTAVLVRRGGGRSWWTAGSA
ncbi:SDR family oxidoreductase [Streptomyces sp. NPDC006514]|uniref:SDR family oxidoreductase n=1 Tax=Streptomyces sp. NPDC006514 TaxID=3154308 RepID=UPI0033A7F763